VIGVPYAPPHIKKSGVPLIRQVHTLDHAYRAVDVAPLYEGIARWRADDGG
jgi:hypothetical protein